MKKIYTLISILSVSTSYLLAQATPSPGFELWTHHTGSTAYDNPNGWDSPNSQTAPWGTVVCMKATAAADIHGGTFAAQLITLSVLGLGTSPGVISTGTFPSSFTGSITGGIAYTLRPDSIVGWYKYAPQGADKGFANFAIFGTSSTDTVAQASFDTPNANVTTYTRFSAPMVYKNTHAVTNSVWVVCSSNAANPIIGSKIFADDLDLIFAVRDSIALTSGTNPMCTGQSATFTAYPHNGGTTPSYQWKVNGSSVGSNSSTYTTGSLASGDVVTCVLTSNMTIPTNGGTLSGNPATSPAITMVVGIPTPTIQQNGAVLTSNATSGNQWYLNGTAISGATSQTYTPNQVGNYTVVVTANGCTSSASAPVNITTVGIDQSNNDSFFTIYPNPNDGNFNVSFNITLKATYKLELKNTLGQLVYHETLTDFSGSYLKQLNVTQFGKGNYIISLTNPNNETIKKVLVY